MEWVEVVERTASYIKLRYYPEQNAAIGEYGEVTYFFLSGKWVFDKIHDGYPRNYAMHACNFARLRYEKGEEIPRTGLVGWY